MKRVVITLLSLLSVACVSSPGGSKFVSGPDGTLVLPVEVLGSPILRVGESLRISNPTGVTAMAVSFTNKRTGAERTITVEPQAGSPGTVTLDGSSLPDLVEDSKLQLFEARVVIQPRNRSTTRDIYVVSEAGVQPFPKVTWQYGPGEVTAGAGALPLLPPGKVPMTATSSQAGIDAYVQRLIEDWKLEQPEVIKASIARGSVTIPDWLRTMPEDVELVEVRVGAGFSTYLVPDVHTPSGQFDVFSPSQMSFVLTQTSPAVLVTLTAIQ